MPGNLSAEQMISFAFHWPRNVELFHGEPGLVHSVITGNKSWKFEYYYKEFVPQTFHREVIDSLREKV